MVYLILKGKVLGHCGLCYLAIAVDLNLVMGLKELQKKRFLAMAWVKSMFGHGNGSELGHGSKRVQKEESFFGHGYGSKLSHGHVSELGNGYVSEFGYDQVCLRP